MDLNYIALWLSALPVLIQFLKSVRARNPELGWIAVTSLVPLVAGAGWFAFREYAGYVTGSLVLAFIVAPTRLHEAASLAVRRFDYRRARVFSTLAALLHPVDEWPALPRLYHAFQLAHEGKTAESDALLQLIARGDGATASTARAQRLRILARWKELRELGERAGLAGLSADPNLLILYLRALGELGEVEDMAEFMRANESLLLVNGLTEPAVLYLFTFAGQVSLTRLAIASANPGYDDDTRDAWLALATKCAGEGAQARRMFGKLRESSDAQIRERAEHYYRRLALTAPDEPPSARTQDIVQHFARALTERQNRILNNPAQRKERPLTLLLVVVNALVYLVGSYPWRAVAGSSDARFWNTASDFGGRWASIPRRIYLDHEWWRLASYMFVHANLVHLLMNLSGLWVLGPFVERSFGRLRFCVIYFASGFAGSAVYLIIGWHNPQVEGDQLVGASGCIMGLLGAFGAVMLRAWLTQRAPMARQVFFRVLLVVAFQGAFDHFVPNIAGLAHGAGLLAGFLTALALRDGFSSRRPVAALG